MLLLKDYKMPYLPQWYYPKIASDKKYILQKIKYGNGLILLEITVFTLSIILKQLAWENNETVF